MANIQLLNEDSLFNLKEQDFCSIDLLVLDPPFNWEPSKLSSWLDEAVRVCRPDGNIAIFNTPKNLAHQWAIINQRICNKDKFNLYHNITLADWIMVANTTSKPKVLSLATRIMSMMILTKNPGNRKIYANKLRHTGWVHDPDKYGIVTDCWFERIHKPGAHGKFRDLEIFTGSFKHSTATAPWVIERLLYCYARKGDKVYDAFGGAGTVPMECKKRDIDCISIEIDPNNYKIMQERLSRATLKNSDFADIALHLIQKAEEAMEGPYTNTEEKNGWSKEKKQFAQEG